VQSALTLLIESGLSRLDAGKFHPVAKKTNLKPSSLLVGRHKINWRLKALEQVPKLVAKDLFFTGVVRIDRKSYDKIKLILKDAVKEVHESIETADDELLACVNIDLFEL
jgi:hypothetical protein